MSQHSGHESTAFQKRTEIRKEPRRQQQQPTPPDSFTRQIPFLEQVHPSIPPTPYTSARLVSAPKTNNTFGRHRGPNHLDRKVVAVEVHRRDRGGEEEEVAGPPRERADGLGSHDGGPDRRGQGPRGAPLSLGGVGLGRPRAPLALLQRRLPHPAAGTGAAGLLAAARSGRRRLQLLDLGRRGEGTRGWGGWSGV